MEWIKMKLGLQVDHDTGLIVLDGDPARIELPLPIRAQPPIFRPIGYLLWPNGWMD